MASIELNRIGHKRTSATVAIEQRLRPGVNVLLDDLSPIAARQLDLLIEEIDIGDRESKISKRIL